MENFRDHVSEAFDATKLKHLVDLDRLNGTFHWETDQDGRYTYVSPTVEHILGYHPTEITGCLSFFDLFPEDHREAMKAEALAVFARREPFVGFENKSVSKSGVVRWLSTNGLPMLDEQGKLLGYRGTDRDITAERETRETNRKLSQVVQRVDSLVMITDPQERIEFVNPGFERHTGYSAAEVLGKRPNFLHGNETDPDHKKAIAKGVASGAPFQQEVLNYTKSGEPYWVQLDISPIRDSAGRIERFVSIGVNVTEHKKLEQSLREERNLLATILRTTPTAITVTDAEGRITFANRAAASVLGLHPRDALGVVFDAPVWQIEAVEGGPFPPDELPFRRIKDSGEAVSGIRHAIRWPDGTRKILCVNGTPLEVVDGQITKIVFTITDVSIEEEATQRLQNALGEAKASIQSKQSFLNTISHELLTPLNPIIAMSEYLLMTDPKDVEHADIQMIHDAGEELLKLVNQILEVAKGSDPGTIEGAESLLLKDLPDALDRRYRQRANNKDLVLTLFEVAPEHGTQELPARPLLRAIDCLVDNALKFTDQGSIAIGCQIQPQPDQSSCLVLTVRDTGCGISEDQQEAIFEPFFQVDSSITRDHGGAGLGLTVARQIVNSLGGQITLDPHPPAPFCTGFLLKIPLS